jgi:hypothetical protein
MKAETTIMTEDATQVLHEEWHELTIRLRDDMHRQIAEQRKMQANLQQWYAAKPGKVSQKLELHECPSLLRVMQTIRSLKETLAEFDHELSEMEDGLQMKQRKTIAKILSEMGQQITEIRWLADDFLSRGYSARLRTHRGRSRSRRACPGPFIVAFREDYA